MKTLLILLLALAVILIVIAKIHPIGKKISLYIVLGLIALIMLVPFYMMFVMATHTTSEIYSFPPALWFGTNLSNKLPQHGSSSKLPAVLPEQLYRNFR
ncbi:MAG: hypothetical protein ACLVAT_05360 [Lachnospiraceae bacterium]